MSLRNEKTLTRTITFKTQGNHKSVVYKLCDEDHLVLSRAVEFEGEQRDGIAWTLLQRFAYIYPQYESLATLIRTYSQPINPSWFPNGVKHLNWLNLLIREGKLNEAAIEDKQAMKRLTYSKTSLTEISKPTRDTIDFVFSSISPIPGSVHYRAPTVSTDSIDIAHTARNDFARKHYLAKPIDYGSITKDNWFFAASSSINFNIKAIWS